jgi:glycosyltransferase involved in cell wall biosynthesis
MPHKRPKILVIVGFYQGHQYIKRQVQSILAQENVDVNLEIYDDASIPPLFLSHLDLDKNQTQKVTVNRRAKNLGFQMNFLNVLQKAGNEFDYYAFSDQDDEWYPNRLERAITKIESVKHGQAVLYGARTEAWDAALKTQLGVSPLFNKRPSFGNALVQSIMGGNTLVMNRACRSLICQANYETIPVSHDWWCYQLVSGAGGTVVYDDWPCLKYRQHAGNVVGSNRGWDARLKRLRRLLSGDFYGWNSQNIAALERNAEFLTPENKNRLREFRRARNGKLLTRLLIPLKYKIARQTTLGQLGLLLGLSLGRV